MRTSEGTPVLRGGSVKRQVCVDTPSFRASALASHTSKGCPTSSGERCASKIRNMLGGRMEKIHFILRWV